MTAEVKAQGLQAESAIVKVPSIRTQVVDIST